MPGADDGRELVLASGSPRRSQLLAEAGIPFVAVTPSLSEPDDILTKLPPLQQAEALAYFKARAVAEQMPGRYVLGADTIVAKGSEVLGKPSDEAAARRMLRELSGARHRVITGVALLGPGGERLIASDVTFITMRPMSPREIDGYIASGEWRGKAGAYAIQETADRFVAAVEGSFSNVVGLPLELVRRMLRELREHPEAHKAL